MEAVGAAAAIAELSGLSLRAGKAAKNLMQSFVHAPAEITELNNKIERLHLLIQQIDLLCADLPSGHSDLLFPPQHRALISLGLQRTLDSLVSLKSSGQTPSQNGIRGRIRWASMDKRKAQRFLKNIQEVESELEIPLQVLSMRLGAINRNSIAAVAAGQALVHETLLKSVEEIKVLVFREVSRLQTPETQIRNPTTAVSAPPYNRQNLSGPRKETDDLVRRLDEYNLRRTLGYYEATIGNNSRNLEFENGWSSVGASAVLHRKRNSTKIKFLLSLACKLFGATILKAELQVSINCRFWRLEPHIASSITVLNLRPTNSPIFVACRRRDLNQVHYLLHTGEASVYDFDEEVGGLLEHVLFSDVLEYEENFLPKGQRLLEYLLDRGCDAGLYLEGSRCKRPAILLAFETGFSAAVSSMTSHGADLNDFGNRLAGLFGGTWSARAAFIWQVGFLRSLGYSDWQASQSMDNILYGACWHRQMDLVCFALEVVGIDPNVTGTLDRAPIGNAAQENWVEGIVVLVAAGARVNISNQSWNGTPLIRVIEAHDTLTDTGQFLLLQGAKAHLCKSDGINPWSSLWTSINLLYVMLGQDSINFVDFGSSLAHLLHHGADPFEVFTTRPGISPLGGPRSARWYDEIGYVRASDLSVLFSQGVEEWEADVLVDWVSWEEIERELLLSEVGLKTFDWDYSGNIRRVHDGMDSEDTDSDATESEYSSETESSSREHAILTKLDPSSTSNTHHVKDGEWDEGIADAYEYSDDGVTSTSPASTFYNGEDQEFGSRFDATRFYHHITNVEGRRQLSRFPLVRALCDALQHSGYRAEMDDDGDIWYDCDDGDRYLDAWEHQDDDHDDETWLPKACPICQDFEGHGLGHILEIAERARAEYSQYKDKVKQGKISMCL